MKKTRFTSFVFGPLAGVFLVIAANAFVAHPAKADTAPVFTSGPTVSTVADTVADISFTADSFAADQNGTYYLYYTDETFSEVDTSEEVRDSSQQTGIFSTGSEAVAALTDLSANMAYYVKVVLEDSEGVLQEKPATIILETLEPYVLFAPMATPDAYLIDMDGGIRNTWQLTDLTTSVYLLEDNQLLAPYHVPSQYFQEGDAWVGGGIEILDWCGNRVYSYELKDNPRYHLHHDIERMQNGNILATAYERITRQDAIDLGFDESYINEYGEVWSDAVFEIDLETGEIVWEWHVKDHLLRSGSESSDYPGLINPAYPLTLNSTDWLHINAIDYNEALKQIILSVRNFKEIWIINHALTESEARGHLGDLLFRFGNPEAYGESGDAEFDRGQHDVHWIDPNSATSNILLYNNKDEYHDGTDTSTVVELKVDTPYEFGSATIVWEYGDDTGEEKFYSNVVSSVQRLPTGGNLICSGADAEMMEIDENGNKVWEYVNTEYGAAFPDGSFVTHVFRAKKYYLDLE
uniref:Arylsulfotransferase (ASST) n=1 Tax=Candidatus Kentrum sp. FM TaxID=2126340 RepID=A0A450TWN0_9GAMM|nr:MAG: Arylsulfotransferase (ASST) [Candidatus Kentron sp. FM]VFJ73454.1 MAG: Arylsulfotransferase (ASST) [Candidatus Kentron sp. FM]VFK19963.1 MAG: Arylsulfotransferase (ASST) [Candidatus Kentron sp. FM]